ncbi:MAG TPA: cytochrome P450 [Stellaceae bacterium]|nr:cytochrome P450 [Stellaceae bacterium]
MTDTAQAAPVFNPLAPEFIRDPYPFFHKLRAYDPLWPSPFGRVSTRHKDVTLVLRDKRFGKDFMGRARKNYGDAADREPVLRIMRLAMLTQDPPDHTRLRGLVVKAFTARRIDEMRPRIQRIVDAAIDRVESQGHMDVIADLAFRLPVAVICDMLGIPPDHQERFLAGARMAGRAIEPVPMSRAELDAANAGQQALKEYFLNLFELRRREPGEDLTTQLLQVEEAGSQLTADELIANILLLFVAGHETTVNLIGNGLLALYRNPGQLQKLRDDPALIGNAIEEFLRYDSSVQVTYRVALEDLDLNGTKIAKDDSVLCLLGAANRDPEAYPEPDRLDIARPNIHPLSFGGGIHHCLGAQLARIEAEVALGTLVRRLPGLALENVENPEWRPTFVLRGLKSLPAHW